MDCTMLAYKLIKAYNKEHNRLRRARHAKHKVSCDQEFQAEMKSHGLGFYLHDHDRHIARRTRDFFVDLEHRQTEKAFVSQAQKNKAIQQEIKQLEWNRSHDNQSYIAVCNQKIEELNKAPVLAELGIKWRKLIDAIIEEKEAYETRWEARCAIKAFNKMDTGVLIKFGHAGHDGGSMSYIRFVVIDGDKLPLKKFLDNAEFEKIVLGA